MNKIMCQKCGIKDNLTHVSCGELFLGYLCTQHYHEFATKLIKLQEQYFQTSMEEFKKFVAPK